MVIHCMRTAVIGLFLMLIIGPLPETAWALLKPEVVSSTGELARVIGPEGEVARSYPPGQGPLASAPDDRAASAETGPGSVEPKRVTHVEPDRIVDADGRITPVDREHGSSEATAAALAERITIDSMETGSSYTTYYTTSGLVIFGRARRYYLSDGSSWSSGAGTTYMTRATFERAEVDGDTVRYYLNPPADGILYKQTDYNAGDHSSNGSLGPAGPLVLEATIGDTVATMSGTVEILSNVPANYPEPRFNYWSAVKGSVVPFEATFTLLGGKTWEVNTFDADFTYRHTAIVDFADPSATPALSHLEIQGSAQVPPAAKTQFYAIAHYENDALENVTAAALWSVTPATAASVEGGLLSTKDCDGVALTLHVSFTKGDSSIDGEKIVQCRMTTIDEWVDYWETYQGDERHSGYVPLTVEPNVFSVRWERTVAEGAPLHPVTAADGKVYVSLAWYRSNGDTLFALDARDGELLWSRSFAAPFSINPPAYGYGNVYIQTGNHGSDTYLWAFDADTGQLVFQSPHSAQWERYWAPTVYDGAVYVNGGYYGGMYAFDAFSGASLWFSKLPQYDEFTPAVDEDYAYAYVGEYSPGLYVVHRETGLPAFKIPDPNFDWNGWSMRLAPVLGSMDDVIAIHDGRLISFDLPDRSIRYEFQGDFVGQPSVAKGVVYVINGGRLEAREETTGALLRSWLPPTGSLSEHVIVTDTHIFARTASHTYAVEILSLESDWSYPAAGHMALGEETLYIAAADGTLTAISVPEYTPALLERIEIEGPTEVEEYSSVQFSAIAYYEDGRIRNRTNLSDWSVEPSNRASIDEYGRLTVGELLEPSQQVVVSAFYSEGESSAEADLQVKLVISVSLDDFVERNLKEALLIKQQVLADLTEAAERERAAQAVVEQQMLSQPALHRSLKRTLQQIKQVLFWGDWGRSSTARSATNLEQALEDLGEEPPAGPTKGK